MHIFTSDSTRYITLFSNPTFYRYIQQEIHVSCHECVFIKYYNVKLDVAIGCRYEINNSNVSRHCADIIISKLFQN